jgi:hypothetical protein
MSRTSPVAIPLPAGRDSLNFVLNIKIILNYTSLPAKGIVQIRKFWLKKNPAEAGLD